VSPAAGPERRWAFLHVFEGSAMPLKLEGRISSALMLTDDRG
jgi:hypothetical protein